MRLLRWLRDRFTPAPVPEGWTPEAFAEIRPHFQDTAPTMVIDPELGPLDMRDLIPQRPLLFEQLRDLNPVDLNWSPSWVVAA